MVGLSSLNFYTISLFKTMKNLFKTGIILCAFLSFSCEDDKNAMQEPFVIGFEKQAVDYSIIENEYQMQLVFSEVSKASGSVKIKIVAENATLNTDFSVENSIINNVFEIPFSKGSSKIHFTFKNLIFPFDRSDKSIQFIISEINYPFEKAIQGYSQSIISFNRSIGGTLSPEVGGPNLPYSIYVDLSKERLTSVKRDAWDLGFYSGNEFQVSLNGSIYMAAKKLETNDLNQVNELNAQQYFSQVAVGTFDPANENFIDDPSGNISLTAISEISENDSENKVYLLNLGYSVGTDTPNAGGVAVAGTSRGWKKIRILRDGTNYKLQYANLNDSSFETINIPKSATNHFSHFSFNTNNLVQVEPFKDSWDLNFTVFTNIIEGSGSYGYSDFVVNNIKSEVLVYQVTVSNTITYENFNIDSIDETKFTIDQRIIGADWRDVFSGVTKTDRFYVLKDPESNYYKIRMLAFVNQTGIRGFPKFEYKLIK